MTNPNRGPYGSLDRKEEQKVLNKLTSLLNRLEDTQDEVTDAEDFGKLQIMIEQIQRMITKYMIPKPQPRKYY